MYTSNESLREVDDIIRAALEGASRNSGSSTDPMLIASAFRTQIDQRRIGLSESLYKVDLAMKGYDDGAMRAEWEMMDVFGTDPMELSDAALQEKFIRETTNGYQIYDSRSGFWEQFSKESEITLTLDRAENGLPAMVVSAYDPADGKRLFYTDAEITQGDLRSAEFAQWAGGYDDWREITYSSDVLGGIKSGSGAMGKASGTINAFMMGQHYRHSFLNHKGMSGIQWKATDGGWYNYQEIEKAKMPFRQQSLKNSHDWALRRGQAARPIPIKIGKICFWVSFAVSSYNALDAQLHDDANKWGVTVKAGLDITMGAVAFIPGLGWAVSGTYFLLDAGGFIGDWGKSSGYSVGDTQRWSQERSEWASKKISEMDFEIDYEKPIDQVRMEMMHESREVARDKTFVAPRNIYKTYW